MRTLQFFRDAFILERGVEGVMWRMVQGIDRRWREVQMREAEGRKRRRGARCIITTWG